MEWFSAIAILRQGDRLLAMSRGNDLNNLCFPGGKRDATDSLPSVTAARELYEETGLVAKEMIEVYAAFSNRGICRAFMVPEWEGRLKGMTREGLPIWVPPEMLVRRCSQYHDFNRKMYAVLRANSLL